MRFGNNCKLETDCISHLTQHAISDASDNCFKIECEKEHNKICTDCFNSVKSVNKLKQETEKIPSPDKDYRISQISDSFKDMCNCMKEILDEKLSTKKSKM